MTFHIQTLLIHWGVMVLALWLTSSILKGMAFSSVFTLLVSALLLCVANIVMRPVLGFIPHGFSPLVLGLVLLVVNALLIMFIASLLKGFKLSGVMAPVLACLIIAILGMFLELVLPGSNSSLFHIQQLVHIK